MDGTVLGRTIPHSAVAARKMQQAWTAPIGVAELPPTQPTTGEMIPAIRKVEAMPAGTYGTWPAGMKHYVWVKGDTVVQFHGDGPWAIEYVDPADDPRKKR